MVVATQSTKSVEELCINSIRFLAVDAIEKASSGHPGLPMGAAPMAFVLWDFCWSWVDVAVCSTLPRRL